MVRNHELSKLCCVKLIRFLRQLTLSEIPFQYYGVFFIEEKTHSKIEKAIQLYQEVEDVRIKHLPIICSDLLTNYLWLL